MLQATAARGPEVPRDSSLIGGDDIEIEIAQATTPPLTSMRLPMYAIRFEAALAAAALVRGSPQGSIRKITPPTLSERLSVSAPRL